MEEMVGEKLEVFGIKKFDGTDFWYWKMQIEDYLYVNKLHLPLLGEKPETMSTPDWRLLDRQVLGIIRFTLSISVARKVVEEKTTVELMTALSRMYEKSSDNNKVNLMKKLFNLKMEESTSVTEHLNEFNTITNQLSSVKIEFDDEIRALILLASLPNSWEAMRMTVSKSTEKSKLKYDDILNLILIEDVRRRDSCRTSGSGLGSALDVDSPCDRGGFRDRRRRSSRSRCVSPSPM